MEQEAQALLANLKRSSVAIDQKVTAFNNVKSNIKHLRVPDAAQPTIFECIRIAISSSQSPALAATAFSTLGHLIKRLSLQTQNNVIVAQAKKLLPILLERLGDSRESHRNAAAANLGDFFPFVHDQVEAIIKDNALAGNSPRAKETAMMWVLKMHKAEGMAFKAYVPQLVACLEDADGMVRETAKSTIVELFRGAPDHAKTDLKKRLKMQDVRHTIVSHIVSQLDMRPTLDVDLGASTMSVQTMPDLSSLHGHNLGDSHAGEHPPQQESAPVEPLYVTTNRELEDTFRDMQALFEGRETEHNWMARDKSITKIRRLVKGNAPTEFHAAFVAGIRTVVDGITRVSTSLRTTVSSNACQLVQELARSLGSALEPVELIVQNFIKMSANTKQIAANNGNTTVEVLISNVSYNKRLLEHTWFSFQEKNVQTRTFATGWLKLIIKKHGSHKSQIEHSGGLEYIDKCIKKGLGDANPKVREGTRAAFWAFSQIWSDHADKIMDGLDPKSRQQLEKDPHNPSSNSLASSVSSLAASTKTRPAASSRPSVRDAIAAQRKAALAAKNMPERPSSAQAHFSPVKSSAPTASGRMAAMRTNTARPPSALSREPSSVAQSSQSSAGSSLMAAPVRRPRRPEMARPATADPYASRRAANQQSTPTMSPQTSPQKATKSSAKAPARTPARAMAPTASSTIRTKSRTETSATVTKKVPRRSTTGAADSPISSPSRGDDLTMVVPFTKPPDSDEVFGAPNLRGDRAIAARQAIDSSMVEDDEGFTMVLPPQPDQRPGSSGIPMKVATPRLSPHKASSASPLSVSRLRSPAARSPERLRSPLPATITTAESDPVQVYEDPFTSGGAEPEGEPIASEHEKPVLEELPVDRTNERQPSEDADVFNQSTRSNEQNIDVQRTPRHHKTTSTGSVIAASEVTAETLRSRRLLVSGIERIKAKTLDAHGFRRVQDIVKNGQDVWGDDGQKFGELLVVLLDYLEAPNDTLKVSGSAGSAATKAQSLKGQVLATIRALLTLHRREAGPYYSRALCSVIVSRRQWDETMHIVADIEKTVDEIIKLCNPLDSLTAVLDLLEHLAQQHHHHAAPTSPGSSSSSEHPTSPIIGGIESSPRTASFALQALAQLLTTARGRNLPISPQLNQRLGTCAVRYLQDPDSDVRKADLDFCLAMHEGGGEEEFWKVLRSTGVREGSVNLITYYIAKSRRGRTAA